jgi:hypothetical protein
MQITGKPVSVGVGVFFIVFGVAGAAAMLWGAKSAASPFLFVCIFGGLFMLLPAVLGIAVVYEHLHKQSRNHTTK